MVAWSQHLLAEVLAPGDLVVDLTAGQGRDSLFLFQRIGAAGRLLAFDIQEKSLEETCRLLTAAGASVHLLQGPSTAPLPAGVYLVHASHAQLADYLQEAPKGVIANLGYLPGGETGLTTSPASTLQALNQACHLLAPGGRLAVTAYVGHAGGETEGEVVRTLFRGLSPAAWQVLQLEVPNRRASPFLLLAERRG